MFWKKSKDKDKSKSITTIYRTDGGATSSGSAITSYESKFKSSANTTTSKTKITISTSQAVSQKQQYSSSSQFTRTFTGVQPGDLLSMMDSSKWTPSTSLPQTILPRQKTESSIVRRLDASPFNSKYESPYRSSQLSTVNTPKLPAAKVTTVTTTYQSPYRGTGATSSMREKKTSTLAASRPYISGSTGLLSPTPKTTSSSIWNPMSSSPKTTSTSIWNPMSSTENARPTVNPTWNKITISQPKISSSTTPLAMPTAQTNSISTAKPSQVKPSSAVVRPPVNKKKLSPGVVYIFHNDKFDSPDKEFRSGSKQDVRLLTKAFQSFKMQINVYDNLTVKDVENKVRKIETKDYGNASCIVIVILTHGTRHETVAAKDGSYSIDDTILFPILRNRSLRSKPKLLFIQACKGPMEPEKFHKDSSQPNGPPDEILKCYSTFEGYVAYRTERGSLFIQSLCELLEAHGRTKNIKDIMDMVTKSVKDRSTLNGSIQIPSYFTTLTEPYIFGDYV